jgi:pilus assembly protein Flp/PilA
VSIVRDDKGATAIEYGLIASLIAMAAITSLQSVGSAVSTTFQEAATALENQ